jgi:small subunit ribosomal protein S16
MALKIRLRQQGCNNRTVYRFVVTDARNPRDGKYVEALGWYNPCAPDEEQQLCLHTDKLQYWLDRGAQPTDNVRALVGKAAPDVLRKMTEREVAQRAKRLAKRKAGRARALAG